MGDLTGLVLHHKDFGYCKITDHIESKVQIKFMGTNRDSWYGVNVVAAQKDFKWTPLPVGLKCRVIGRGICSIFETAFSPSEDSSVHEYLVNFEGIEGLTGKISERQLWPIPGSLVETPTSKILSLQPDPIHHFRTREGFLSSLNELNRESDGITALLGSRIDLLPHQSYVVKTALDDPICRFILADEVGLGKTIEAGVIAHQVLVDKPNARILILTPGPLARQWLSEMHTSFGGRDFRLLDLHSPANVTLSKWPLVISSIKVALRSFRAQILQNTWDLVIVDEAHQLLWHQSHYRIVEDLALKSPKLLLLSAVPARERSAELLRLLRLIEPIKYSTGSFVSARFEELYAAQSSIGKRWKVVTRGISKGEEVDIDLVHKDVKRLLSTPVLTNDIELQTLSQTALEASGITEILGIYQKISDEVVSKYRLSRRILKNRKTQLAEQGLFLSVERSVEFAIYQPSELEPEIEQVGLELLVGLAGKTHNKEALHTLARKMLQGICDHRALYEIARSLVGSNNSYGESSLEIDSTWVYDYDEHEDLISKLGNYFRSHVDKDVLARWIVLLRASIDIDQQPRVEMLDRSIKDLLNDGSKKILLFAGTPGTAEFLTNHLIKQFTKEVVASFRNNLSDDDKESQVAKFKNESRCLILVSDESGGEGRNFQFADCLIHFDLPWSVAAIEQRIGRLDRVGRTRPVKSIVIQHSHGIENQWIDCLNNGFGVFTRSISGLEFILRSKEDDALNLAIESGASGFEMLIDAINEASEIERATDDAEAITDAISNRERQQSLRPFRPDIDRQLEQCMPSYMRMISRPEAAKSVIDKKDLNLKVWRLRPEDVTEYKLPGMDRDGDNPLRERYGTFNRSVARERLDLEFFSIGHPMVDALTSAMNQLAHGRTFFVKTSSSNLSNGIYVVSNWKVGLVDDPRLPERVKRLLGIRRVCICLDASDRTQMTEENRHLLLNIIKNETPGLGDLYSSKAIEVLQTNPGEWSTSVKEFIQLCEKIADESYGLKYGQDDELMCKRWEENLDYIEKHRPEETQEYSDIQHLAIDAVKHTHLELDSLGLVQVIE